MASVSVVTFSIGKPELVSDYGVGSLVVSKGFTFLHAVSFRCRR